MTSTQTRPPDASDTAMSADGLTLRYGKTTVVQDISMSLRPGHVTALVGPNGSGKSTLLRSLARLHPIGEGQVRLHVADQPERAAALLNAREFARQVTLFSQSRTAPQGLSVREVVALGRHPYRRGFGGRTAADRHAVEQAMTVTGIRAFADRPVAELSGGEVQRVWLAACVAQDTTIVLLDEPTNHLDLKYQIETLDLVGALADDHRAAVGIVLHDLDHAARVADTVILMSSGRIHAAGPPLEVLTADNIRAVYDIDVEVEIDHRKSRLRIDPVGRLRARTSAASTGLSPDPTRKDHS